MSNMETFESGAKRNKDTGRGHHELISPYLLDRLAKQLEKGANHPEMGTRNWEKGIPISRFMRSALRHWCDYMKGCQKEDHLAAVAFNIQGAIHMEELINNNRLSDNYLDIPARKIEQKSDNFQETLNMESDRMADLAQGNQGE